jgi:4-amino-4-deoxy-L-arabinose transferase-like glycosyltransferase
METAGLRSVALRLAAIARAHKAEVLLLLLAAVLVFTSLGDRSFGGDEPFGVELAGNIVRYGIPLMHDSPGLDSELTLTINSPLSEYLMASSFMLFGFSEFSARLPFAVFGLLSIVAIYLLTLRVSGNRKLALIALVLVVLSAAFYLHTRHARYYILALFLNTVLIYAFHEFFIKRNGGKWPYAVIASITLLFYAHPETALYTSVAAVAWLMVKRKSVGLKRMAFVAGPSLLLLLPLGFLVLSSKTYSLTAAGLPPIVQAGFFGIFAYYMSSGVFYYLIFFVPILFLFALPKALRPYDRSVLLLFALLVLSHLVVASAVGPFGTPSIRKLLVGTFPVAIFANAAVIYFFLAKTKRHYKVIGLAALALLSLTNLLFLFPAVFFKDTFAQAGLPVPEETKRAFVANALQPRFYMADLLYEITHHFETPIEKTLEFLRDGKPGDTILYPRGPNLIPYTDQMGMKLSSVIDDARAHSFDWVIWEDVMGNISEAGIDVASYEAVRYSIPSWRDNFWIDTADPVHHSFNSEEIPKLDVTIYRKK